MKLERISIHSVYGESRYRGMVTFTSATGDIKLNLNNTLSQRVLDVVADELLAASKEVASHLTAAIISAAPALALEGSKEEGGM